jgi:predicted dehydrogenase
LVKDNLGVAILGYGFMGGMHLEGWKQIPESHVTGIWSRSYDKTKVKAKEMGGLHAYETLRDVFEDDEVDIVDVCTPSFVHAEHSIASMNAGKHIFLEKPIALSLRDADAIIDAAKSNGVKLMVGQVLRFFPEYSKAKELVDGGMIGDPVIGRAYRASYFPEWNTWFGDFMNNAGVTIDLSIHDVDFLMWCFNEPVTSVFAKVEHLTHKQITSHDFALINMRFEGGGIALVEGSWAVPKQFPFTMKLDLDGTRGTVQLDNQGTVPVKLITNDAIQGFAPETLPWKPAIHPFPVDPFYRELLHFTDCVLHDKVPMTDGLTARNSLEVCLAALGSAAKGGPVRLPLKEASC